MKTSFPKNMASAAEVARLAGVSRSAVSRTFTPGGSVSEATRKKVLAAAEQLNYHVNHLARGLSKEGSRPVCILGANLNAPYQASLLDTITQRLQQAGRAVMVINTAGGEASADNALRQTLNYRASATIVLSGTPQSSLVETCVNSGQQVILVNRPGEFEGTDHVNIDYQSAMADAHHMLARAGCHRLTVVSSTVQSPSLLTRERLFMQTAETAGHSCACLRAGPTSYATGAEAARQLLASRHRPEGVFCVTDLIACGFIDVARHEFGLRIPEDICIIGFDDIEQSSWIGYQLTTFTQPLTDMADAMIDLLHPATHHASTDHSLADQPQSAHPLTDHLLTNQRRPQTLTFQAPPVWRKTVRPA